MGNMGIGYSSYMAYGPVGFIGISVGGEIATWTSLKDAIGSWGDNLIGAEEAQKDLFGPIFSDPIFNWAIFP